MMDAVRLLPLLVLGFWMVPLLWPCKNTLLRAMLSPCQHALRYVFGVWRCGIACCFLLWRRTARQMEQGKPKADGVADQLVAVCLL